MSRPVRLAGLFLVLCAVCLGCNDDKPKPSPDAPKKSTPVPSNMVFNDFLPSSGQADLAVRVDGGLLEAGAADATTATPGAAAHLKVTNPGAEPRAPRAYAFVQGRKDRRVLTIHQTITQQGRKQQQPPLEMTVEFVPKSVKPGVARFEMKVVKVELADKDKLDPRLAQAVAQQFGAFKGLTASFEVSSHGEIGEVSLSGTEKMQQKGAAEVLDAFSQFVELVLAPLPTEPIGEGATWERDESSKAGGLEQKSKRTFELTKITKAGGTIVSKLEKNVPKSPVPDPRMPPGTTMQVDATGTYTYDARWDRLATSVKGEQLNKVTIEVPGPGGQKQAVAQEVTIEHVMTTPGAAAPRAGAAPAAPH